jgi:hypothetical protein
MRPQPNHGEADVDSTGPHSTRYDCRTQSESGFGQSAHLFMPTSGRNRVLSLIRGCTMSVLDNPQFPLNPAGHETLLSGQHECALIGAPGADGLSGR